MSPYYGSHRWDFELIFAVLSGLLGIFVIIFLLIYSAIDMNTTNRCLSAGWREGKVSWNFSRFCITRTDQTDIVRPLKWAEENPQ